MQNMWKPQHHAKINRFVLPGEPHSRCSTAMLNTFVSLYFPMLMTVLFPPFSGTDPKLQETKIGISRTYKHFDCMQAFSNTHNINYTHFHANTLHTAHINLRGHVEFCYYCIY